LNSTPGTALIFLICLFVMSMKVQNQTGKLFLQPSAPLWIVSLVPSITELLFDLGLEKEVVGITKFCVHPFHWFKTKTRVGGTKTVSIQKVKALKPNLIIANKEENVKDQIEELAKEFPVYVSEICTVADAYAMIKEVGALTGTFTNANVVINSIQTQFSKKDFRRKLKALYLIWKKPYMSVGGDTYINSMLEAAGFINILKHQYRYPVISIDEINLLEPDVILLSSEPFPFKQKHIDELKQITRVKNIILADGEMFSWYGTRMIQAPSYFAKLRESLFLNDETTAQV
jgi:ABC-type Fe3+-hydroxamate transport system substrate-binding protein